MIVKPKNIELKECFGIADFPAQAHAPAHVHKKEEEYLHSDRFWENVFDVNQNNKAGTCILFA